MMKWDRLLLIEESDEYCKGKELLSLLRSFMFRIIAKFPFSDDVIRMRNRPNKIAKTLQQSIFC